jgi:hypothetical protein
MTFKSVRHLAGFTIKPLLGVMFVLRDARLTARQSTIFYAVDPRLGSWSTISGDVPGGT